MTVIAEQQWVRYGDRRHALAQAYDKELLLRVQRGVDLLREQYGEDWVDHINPEKLNLMSSDYCVLGQLYNGYITGTRALDIDGHEIGCDTFAYGGGEDADRIRVDYDELDDIWLEVIEAFRTDE